MIYNIEPSFPQQQFETTSPIVIFPNKCENGISHGIIADNKGNIYLSDSPNKAIRYVTADGRFETLVKDKRLIWPDTFSVGNDG